MQVLCVILGNVDERANADHDNTVALKREGNVR